MGQNDSELVTQPLLLRVSRRPRAETRQCINMKTFSSCACIVVHCTCTRTSKLNIRHFESRRKRGKEKSGRGGHPKMKYRLPFPVFFRFLLPVFVFYSLGEHVYSYEAKARRSLGASLVRSDISFAHRERMSDGRKCHEICQWRPINSGRFVLAFTAPLAIQGEQRPETSCCLWRG